MTDVHAALVRELEALAPWLEPLDRDVDVAGTAADRIRRAAAWRRRRRRLLVAAVAAAIVGVLTVSVPATRHAVADLLGLGGERFTVTTTLPEDIGTRLDLGRRASIRAAHAQVTGPVTFPRAVGAPDAAYVGRPPNGVSFVWAPSSALPAVEGHDEIGMLLGVFPGDVDDRVVAKLLPQGTTIERLRVDGAPAYWFAGDAHAFMYLDAHGEPQPDTARLAANTLVWSRGATTYRLESALNRSRAVALAEAFMSSD